MIYSYSMICWQQETLHYSGLLHNTHVAVSGRSWTLFCCVFRSYYHVWSAVTQYFCYGWKSHALCKLMNTWHIYTAHMSSTLCGSSMLQHFECGNVIEICNKIMFDFYPRLPQLSCYVCAFISAEKTLDSFLTWPEKIAYGTSQYVDTFWYILPNDIEKIDFVQAPVKHLEFLHSVYWRQFSVSIFTTERQSQLVETCDQYEYWLVSAVHIEQCMWSFQVTHRQMIGA